jgi:hypothetical protein
MEFISKDAPIGSARHEPSMISTLHDLVGPLGEAEFLRRFRDRTVAFTPCSGPNRFEHLLGWVELNHLIESGHYPIERLSVLRDSFPLPTSLYLKQGQVDPAAFSSLMKEGAALIFSRLHEYVPRLWKLCRRLAEQTGEQVTAEAIVTTGKTGALSLPCKPEDICALQIAGSERSQLCDPPVVDPVKGMALQGPRQAPPVFDEVLRAGDFLFVPAGCLRRSEPLSERSLQVCILFEPPWGEDVVTSLADRLAVDATYRQPLTRHVDACALAAHEAALKACLIDQVQAWSLEGFLAERAAERSKAGAIHIEGSENGEAVSVGSSIS